VWNKPRLVIITSKINDGGLGFQPPQASMNAETPFSHDQAAASTLDKELLEVKFGQSRLYQRIQANDLVEHGLGRTTRWLTARN
jgi:hypothetical protein